LAFETYGERILSYASEVLFVCTWQHHLNVALQKPFIDIRVYKLYFRHYKSLAVSKKRKIFFDKRNGQDFIVFNVQFENWSLTNNTNTSPVGVAYIVVIASISEVPWFKSRKNVRFFGL
jgi:hypothetical protein